jgi:hypothetical protein
MKKGTPVTFVIQVPTYERSAEVRRDYLIERINDRLTDVPMQGAKYEVTIREVP